MSSMLIPKPTCTSYIAEHFAIAESARAVGPSDRPSRSDATGDVNKAAKPKEGRPANRHWRWRFENVSRRVNCNQNPSLNQMPSRFRTAILLQSVKARRQFMLDLLRQTAAWGNEKRVSRRLMLRGRAKHLRCVFARRKTHHLTR